MGRGSLAGTPSLVDVVLCGLPLTTRAAPHTIGHPMSRTSGRLLREAVAPYGREPDGGHTKISISLPTELVEAARAAAAGSGSTVSAVIAASLRRSIDEAEDRRPSTARSSSTRTTMPPYGRRHTRRFRRKCGSASSGRRGPNATDGGPAARRRPFRDLPRLGRQPRPARPAPRGRHPERPALALGHGGPCTDDGLASPARPNSNRRIWWPCLRGRAACRAMGSSSATSR